MNIRPAEISDAEAIHALVTTYAELDRMLFLSMAEVYENLQKFTIAEVAGDVVGCCALQIIWSDLAEIRSVAIDKAFIGKGIGKALVLTALEQSRGLGVAGVFTLTLEAGFFKRLGFKEIPKEQLPMKVWSDCAKCTKQECCNETAMIYELT
jgi:amino-acid N-acetyltransferase